MRPFLWSLAVNAKIIVDKISDKSEDFELISAMLCLSESLFCAFYFGFSIAFFAIFNA